MQFDDFYNIKEIRSDGNGTVYAAQCKDNLLEDLPRIVALKKFKNYDKRPEFFITEVSNH